MRSWAKDEFNSDDDFSKDQLGEDSVASSRSIRSHLSGGSSYASGTGQSTRTGESEDDTNSVKDSVVKTEANRLFRMRIAFVLILVALALSISLTVYYMTKDAEEEAFESQYNTVADIIMEHFQEIMVEMSAVSGLAVTATTQAESVLEIQTAMNADNDQMITPAEWPFVTLPNFQQTAANARTLAGAMYVSVNPIVDKDQLSLWEKYVQGEANQWIDEGLAFQDNLALNVFDDPALSAKSKLTKLKVDPLHTYSESGIAMRSKSSGPYLPRWQTSPVLQSSMVNENLLENPGVAGLVSACIETKSAILGGFVTAPPGSTSHPDQTTSFFATIQSIWERQQVDYLGDPMSHLVVPIFDRLDGTDRKVVAVLLSTIHWKQYLDHVLPKDNLGVIVVIENQCDGNFTYLIEGNEASPVGFGDLHDRAFSNYHFGGVFETHILNDGTHQGIPVNQKNCPYSFHVFATEAAYNESISKTPIVICISIGVVFIITIVMFLSYDSFIARRQKRVLTKVTQSAALVSSIFPKQIHDRIMAMGSDRLKGDALMPPSHRLKSLANGVNNEQADKPIADFFPNCTVLFCDIAGFSAWSSAREPTQVFVLLQTVYQNFDIIAKRRRVFKVETIRDTYLAVTGLPEPQKHHVMIMAKFAWDCLLRMSEITKELEVSLGPDTGDLSMRFGIHSGSVTAGVLKGDRARFQLFGDTVNTAARMEQTGMKGRIQVSETSARILRKAGKGEWLTPRNDMIKIVWKGTVKTHWLALNSNYRPGSSVGSANELTEDQQLLLKPGRVDLQHRHHQKETRLVDWVADILLEHIKKVRIVHERCLQEPRHPDSLYYEPPEGMICLDEVREAIHMPEFSSKVIDAALDSGTVKVPDDIVKSLQDYVQLIAKKYHNNPFHNFEHACHVTMSVNKLLNRVVAPDLDSPHDSQQRKGRNEVAAEIHDFTHGLTSDPLAVFAIVFSALIHDVDHQGISNVQLIKEQPGIGELYRNKSVAEQNSLDVAWDIFMTKKFIHLRQYIFKTKAEMMRFRQLIVNVVLATDIFDKELGDLRRARWERAFHGHQNLAKTLVDDMRATIVMEHIIQASDVSHTMQHWHVYLKWNRKLFCELRNAYKAGRMGADPATFWYQGELGFFDNYIIPLAKKLRECNVFGVSSDEYLGYAVKNREEWQERGMQMLEQMIKECEEEECTGENSASSGHRSVPETVSIQSHASDTHMEESFKGDENDIVSIPSRTPSRTPTLDANPLVDAVTNVLMKHLRKVIAIHQRLSLVPAHIEEISYQSPDGTIFVDEMKEYINMPKFNARVLLDSSITVDVPDDIASSLREYVDEISRSYHGGNAFHNLEHACCVVTNMDTFLSLVLPQDPAALDVEPHNFTHGLTSDPLAAFALVFAAMVHDVDHRAISNNQLIIEEPEMAKLYRNTSVSEQNALDVAWEIFMADRFDRLRQYIFASRSEMMRFRQLIINVILATDIFSKDGTISRKDRWQRAFHEDGSLPKKIMSDLRATLVMEHMMQASNAGHTMQSWDEYQKWNRRLFTELHSAWKAGRMAANPESFWYKGEMRFFDYFVIPLAKKLQECKVFGLDSDRYLERAMANRAEWEQQGEKILKGMLADLNHAE